MHLPPLLLGVRKLVSPKGGIPLEKEPQGTLGGTHERDSGGIGDFDREKRSDVGGRRPPEGGDRRPRVSKRSDEHFKDYYKVGTFL